MDHPPKKQKLFLVITKSNFGGAQKYVFDLASHMKDCYDLTVLFGGEGLLSEKLRALGVKTVALCELGRDINLGNDFRTFLSLHRIISEEKPDIIHLNSSKIGVLGALAARITWTRPRIIFTAHAWAFNEDRPYLARLFFYILHGLTVLLSDHTITVSLAVKDQMKRFPFAKRKMEVIHLGIDDIPFQGREEARKTLGINTDTYCIGTIAELHPVKGLHDSIFAMQQIQSKPTYLILGEGEERAKLEAAIALDQHCDIRLPGYIKNAAHLLPAFDLFVLPSHSEALGYVLLEAGLASVPVVATTAGGIPEIITDRDTGILVPPGEPRELAKEILWIMEHKKEADEYATRLRSRILAEFSLTAMYERTKAVYTPLP